MVARLMQKAFDRDMSVLGITRSQWVMIVVVARNPGATQRIIADALDMTEAAAGRLIDRLCDDGLLERKPKPDDRRAYCIHLTDKAQPLLDQLAQVGSSKEDEFFAGFAEEDLALLQALLGRIYENVSR
ncbi:MAG: MarR family transcriptional regulator [Alphaproteobacteria bacterium]|nr:MarR family transcriptional regulator [Alphaproteobacteria bacterium]MDE2042763.1 MarR family transcriptional regulator [Alphaproteobacteria bacterium]MDE2340004.1 MarR family transcriptional regulator [Alphaproteobacteria bacterium]